MTDWGTFLTWGGGGRAQRLGVSDYWFVNPDGSLHRRKSITAFTLPKRYLTRAAGDALRFMDWAVSMGANEFRIFCRVDWVGPPGSGVETGWPYSEEACAWVLEQAAERDCHVELVANTGPFGSGLGDAIVQTQRVDELCLAHDNALLSLWNEPQQNGGNDLVGEILKRYTPRTPGWASGVYDQTPYTHVAQIGTTPEGRPIYGTTAASRVGPAMTYHSPRKDDWPRCFKDVFEYSTGQGPNVPFVPGYRGPVMLDEPPQMEVTAVTDDWRAYGAGAALFGGGATAHGNPSFQKCEIPTRADVIACVKALYEGMDLVPLQRYHGYNHPDDRGSLRRYERWGEDGKKYQISVRPFELVIS